MQVSPVTRAVLAGVGCAALLAYVLACNTAFSPDDSQVIYPSFDPVNGAGSVAVYDRGSGKTEQVFSSIGRESDGSSKGANLLRADWMPDGKQILVACAMPQDRVSFILLPRMPGEPVRDLGSFKMDDNDSLMTLLIYPLNLVGSKVYLSSGERLICLDLLTGRTASTANSNKVCLLPGGDGSAVAATLLRSKSGSADGEPVTIGTLDLQSLAFKPEGTLTNGISDSCRLTFNPRTRQFAFLAGGKTNLELCVMKDGAVTFRRPLVRAGTVRGLGARFDWGPRNDRVFASYVAQEERAKDAECGVVEIPLSGDPVRWIPLFRTAEMDDQVLFYAQASLSHDGKTWAMATTLLDPDRIKPEDRALYLVDVGAAKPAITKVPIMTPFRAKDAPGK